MIDLSFIRNFYFPQFILDILKISLFNQHIFDFWLIVHFISGLIIFSILNKLFKIEIKNSLITVFIILLFYEGFEIFLESQDLISGELVFNIILDIIIGIFGSLSVLVYYKLHK
ncbi:MAG: hypothetical protein AABY22_03830 [Nanoarchaeota archaeon]